MRRQLIVGLAMALLSIRCGGAANRTTETPLQELSHEDATYSCDETRLARAIYVDHLDWRLIVPSFEYPEAVALRYPKSTVKVQVLYSGAEGKAVYACVLEGPSELRPYAIRSARESRVKWGLFAPKTAEVIGFYNYEFEGHTVKVISPYVHHE